LLPSAPGGLRCCSFSGPWRWVLGLFFCSSKRSAAPPGYEKEEYIGRHIAEFHADPTAIADILKKLSRGETIHSYEARLRCKDGSIRHVLISLNALWQDGQFVHTR
jgi:PAS domain S-box-containing protein